MANTLYTEVFAVFVQGYVTYVSHMILHVACVRVFCRSCCNSCQDCVFPVGFKEDTFPFRSGSETSSVILRVLNQNVLTLHVLASFCCNFCPNRVSIHYRRFENAILRFLINRKALLVKVC